MNAYKRAIARLEAEHVNADAERQRAIEDEVYNLELDARDHYL